MLLAFATLYAVLLGLHRGLGPSSAGRFFARKMTGDEELSLRLFFLTLLPDLTALLLCFTLGRLIFPRGIYLVICGGFLLFLGVWSHTPVHRYLWRHQNQVPLLREIQCYRSAFLQDLGRISLWLDAFLAGGPLLLLAAASPTVPIPPLLFVVLYLTMIGITRFGAGVLRKRFRVVARRQWRGRRAGDPNRITAEERILRYLIFARRLAFLFLGIFFICAGGGQLF